MTSVHASQVHCIRPWCPSGSPQRDSTLLELRPNAGAANTARQHGAPQPGGGAKLVLAFRGVGVGARAVGLRGGGLFLCACSPSTAPTGRTPSTQARSPCTLMKSGATLCQTVTDTFSCSEALGRPSVKTPSANFTPLRTPFYCELRQNALAPLPEAAPAAIPPTPLTSHPTNLTG